MRAAVILKSETYNFHRFDLTRQGGFIVAFVRGRHAHVELCRGHGDAGDSPPDHNSLLVDFLHNSAFHRHGFISNNLYDSIIISVHSDIGQVTSR